MEEVKEKKQVRRPHAPRARVNITNDIIKNSVEADSSHCMVAEGVRIAFPQAKQISVDIQTIRFSDPKKGFRYVYLTPRIAQVPLIQFDQGYLPAPFSFTLRGGHVTRAQRSAAKKKKTGQKTTVEARKTYQALAKTGLIDRGHGITIRSGGRRPPTTSFARRRAFGVKLLGAPPLPIVAQSDESSSQA